MGYVARPAERLLNILALLVGASVGSPVTSLTLNSMGALVGTQRTARLLISPSLDVATQIAWELSEANGTVVSATPSGGAVVIATYDGVTYTSTHFVNVTRTNLEVKTYWVRFTDGSVNDVYASLTVTYDL